MMSLLSQLRSRGSDRLGLVMIAASLAAIALITAILLWQQRGVQENRIRAQGLSLARMLAGLPYEQLVGDANRHPSLLNTIFQSQNDPLFAYAAIVAADNAPLSVATAPGVTVPALEVPDRHTSWLSERAGQAHDGHDIIEFLTPLYADGAQVAHLRLGYFKPTAGLSPGQLPFLATLALIIFLLTPLCYFLLRSEFRPLRDASEQIVRAIGSEEFRQIEIRPTAELNNFFGQFSAFVEFARQKIGALETENEQLATSKKLISYSKSRIENVLEAIPEAVLILNPSGRITYANRRITAILGVSLDEVLNEELASWCRHPELFDTISSHCDSSTASYLSDTLRLDVDSKNRRSLSVKAYPLFTPTDETNIYGTLIVLRDISKERALQRQQGEFVAHVAHELKTPLNTLALYTEALLDASDDDSQSHIDAANVIHDEVERLTGLIDNLLSITKIEMGDVSINRERLRLHVFLEDAFLVASRSDKAQDLRFELQLPPELGSIMADKDLLRIALNNILGNAVKYSRPGGSIVLHCEESDQTVRIGIRDSGIGIAPDDQERIFDRFYRASDQETRKVAGHGLGLSLARDIVRLHHGTLTVDSAPGRGSEFVIELWKEIGLLKQVI